MNCAMTDCIRKIPDDHPTGYCTICMEGILDRMRETHQEAVASGRDPMAHAPKMDEEGKKIKRKKERVLRTTENDRWRRERLHKLVKIRRGA